MLVKSLINSDCKPIYETSYGLLYQEDCLKFLKSITTDSIDMIFADPPFNLGKDYGEKINDQVSDQDYLNWSKAWILESIRVLKPGGSLFIFNLPKWCIEYGAYLNQQGMLFRHWIACRMPKAFPRGKRMSPAHYSLLYYTKGEPTVFNKIYTPIQVCRHCGGEIRDYGGHRKKLNPQGINLMDIWDVPEEVWQDADYCDSNQERLWTDLEEIWSDIPPVRHRQHKNRTANELAPIMLERVIAMTTNPHQIVVDPFGGSGTTYYAAEKLHRYWLGTDIGDLQPAISRLTKLQKGDIEDWESARGKSKRQLKGSEGVQLNLFSQ